MEKFKFEKNGFNVLFNNDEWRIAFHSYDMDVNSLEILKNWGIHFDTNETFLLLKGKAFLISKDVNDKLTIESLKSCVQYVIPKGEKHAIVLRKDAIVQIVENLDVSNSKQELISDYDKKIIREKVK